MMPYDPKYGKKLAEVRFRNALYEVFEQSGEEYAFAGYFNGELSVTANHLYSALRGLQCKHITGLPEGQLIDFQEAVNKLRGG